jgi:hypothetical protein
MNRKDRKQKKKKERQEKLRRQKHLRHFGEGQAVGADTGNLEGDETDPGETDEQFQRIDAILGDSMKRGLEAAVEVYFEYLRKNLILPCEVTGTEDFRWEEYYVIGPGNKREYERLRQHQPSYVDHYQLLGIDLNEISEWMLFGGDDIAAHVKRISDNKEFTLGLAELKCVDKLSPNFQLLDDYAVFLVNYR